MGTVSAITPNNVPFVGSSMRFASLDDNAENVVVL
jgi:hypothetical protein